MSKTKVHLRSLVLGSVVAALSGQMSHAQAQPVLDTAWRVTPDTSKPGFKWNYFQNTAIEVNSTARTETSLAGLLTDGTGALLPNLGDPTIIGAAIAVAAAANPTNGLLYFEITNVINLSKTDGDTKGNFTPDELEPGLNITTTDSNGQAAEILTYLTLPAGTNTMGVNSDDGFQTSSGLNPSDAFGKAVLGEFSGGRGAGDTLFTFVVQQAGTYPFRTIWENGGGDSNIEWFTVKSDGSKVLVNDVANGGVPAYRAIVGTEVPYVKSAPPPRQAEKTSRSVQVVLADGTGNAVDDNSVTLQIDGKAATLAKKQRSGSLLSLESAPFDGFQAPGEPHTGVLTFKNVSGTYSRTQQWTFYNIENLILPARPVTGENFDSYPEATSAATTVPPGWVATNFTYHETPGFDLTDITSDAFLDWVMITTETVFPLEDEVLDNDKTQLINGQPLTGTNWMSGNLIFVASDGRLSRTPDGFLAPQCQFVVSKPFNLSSVTNPVLTFSSGARLSIGNPDQMTMEYSVDGGSNWLPVIYMRSSSTIVLKSDGAFDALAMFNTFNTNVVPQFPDPATGPRGGKWGDMLAAPITQALAPYVAERNDGIAARRVEAIRLPQASKKSDVRLRLTHLSHCGWEWGVDNIAFYDIPSATSAPTPLITQVVETGGDNEPTDTITAKWTGQTFPVSVANEPVPGAVIGNSYTVGTFGNGAPTFVDRNHRYTNASDTVLIPTYLASGEYIMSGNDNRDNATLTMDVTVSQPVQVYLLIDNRLGDTVNSNPPTFSATNMQWVLDQSWTAVKTGNNRTGSSTDPDEVGIDEGADGTINNWYSVYTKSFSAGTFQLKQADNAGQNMYGAVVTRQQATAPRLAITQQGANVVITFPAGARLQSATGLNVPVTWTDVPGTSPVTVPTSGTQTYYRGVSP